MIPIWMILYIVFGALSIRFVTPSTSCPHAKTDIVFVLDMSSSVGLQNFEKQKAFITEFIDHVEISRFRFQIGVITFSTLVHDAVRLNQYNINFTLKQAIRNLQYTPGKRYTGNAMKHLPEMFSRANGGRASADHVSVIVTNGPADQGQGPVITRYTHILRYIYGIKMTSIGVTPLAHIPEVKAIADDDDHALFPRNFDDLNSLVDGIIQQLCNHGYLNIAGTTTSSTKQSLGTLPVTTTKASPSGQYLTSTTLTVPGSPNFVCSHSAVDLVFILDMSTDVGDVGFQQEKSFINDVIDLVNLSEREYEISVITYSSHVYESIPLRQYHNKTALKEAINLISYINGTRNTGTALDHLPYMYSHADGGRPFATHIAFLVTSGPTPKGSGQDRLVRLMVEKFRRIYKITTFVVGVSSSSIVPEVNDIVNDTKHLFRVNDFSELHTLPVSMMNILCQDVLLGYSCRDPLPDCDVRVSPCSLSYVDVTCPRFCGLCSVPTTNHLPKLTETTTSVSSKHAASPKPPVPSHTPILSQTLSSSSSSPTSQVTSQTLPPSTKTLSTIQTLPLFTNTSAILQTLSPSTKNSVTSQTLLPSTKTSATSQTLPLSKASATPSPTSQTRSLPMKTSSTSVMEPSSTLQRLPTSMTPFTSLSQSPSMKPSAIAHTLPPSMTHSASSQTLPSSASSNIPPLSSTSLASSQPFSSSTQTKTSFIKSSPLPQTTLPSTPLPYTIPTLSPTSHLSPSKQSSSTHSTSPQISQSTDKNRCRDSSVICKDDVLASCASRAALYGICKHVSPLVVKACPVTCSLCDQYCAGFPI